MSGLSKASGLSPDHLKWADEISSTPTTELTPELAARLQDCIRYLRNGGPVLSQAVARQPEFVRCVLQFTQRKDEVKGWALCTLHALINLPANTRLLFEFPGLVDALVASARVCVTVSHNIPVACLCQFAATAAEGQDEVFVEAILANAAVMNTLVKHMALNTKESIHSYQAMVELCEWGPGCATIWNVPGFAEVVTDNILGEFGAKCAVLLRSLADMKELRLPMASHPRVLDALVSVGPSDIDIFEHASAALHNITCDPAACRLWAARALEQRLAIPMIRYYLTSSYTLEHISHRSTEAMRNICATFDVVDADNPRGRFEQLCDLVVAGGGDSRSEFALVQILFMLADFRVGYEYEGAESLGRFSAAFMDALSSNYPPDTFLVFMEPFARRVVGAAGAFCNNAKIMDAVLSELQSAVDGGKQDLKERLTLAVLHCPFKHWEKLVAHPKTAAVLTCFCDHVRGGVYCMRPETLRVAVLGKIGYLCEANSHLRRMVGQQDGLVGAIDAEIAEREGGEGLNLLYRLLGYYATTCSWERLLDINARFAPDFETAYTDKASVGDRLAVMTTGFLRFLEEDQKDRSPEAADRWPKANHVFQTMSVILGGKPADTYASMLSSVNRRISCPGPERDGRSPFQERLQLVPAALAPYVERERVAQEAAHEAAKAAEDALLAELDEEERGGGGGGGGGKKKKKKKKKKGKGGGGVVEEEGDRLTDFQRYEQSETKREVDRRKLQANREGVARVMEAAAQKQKLAEAEMAARVVEAAAQEQCVEAEAETMEEIEAQIAALGRPPEREATMEEIEAQIAALGRPPEREATMEEIEAQIAALGRPPEREATMEEIEAQIAALGPPPPCPPATDIAAQVDELYAESGIAKPEGAKLVELISLLEGELLGQAGEGRIKARVKVLQEIML
ncbi:hypothetical protein TeGR_g13485 [Tetraparma gracilis]|uniref:Uncharacterized protein n=1 Tax=Tetraparma gracilis TaxID=2962635 RepID=A0ABQ6MND1_9STRA|nr:hypothetical protein TeGR_g13485 [Tetraparma gracilis]